ncbi:MAG TPA: hypothetical protein VJS47_06420 [Rhizomicrobium sp.]|nr:hypothetical protein [Rhizomicrobium sp.]
MKLLTRRTLRVFSVLEDYRAGSQDVLDAVLPFFEPILSEYQGKILDCELFARSVRDAYKWNFTADIVEELTSRFEKRGWLKPISKTQATVTYRVEYSNPAALPPGPVEIQISEQLKAIVQAFYEFVGQLSPLSAFSRSRDELADILVEWLVSIDAYTEDVLRAHASGVVSDTGKLGLAVNVPDASGLTSEERYLCARFVKKLFDEKSPFIADLCKIASVGLLTEVIQDFQKPITSVNKTSLVLYLDGPVALDLLGVSGAANAANIRPIIAKLQEIGAVVRVFRVSVNELTHALEAVLKRKPPERVGPTADAIRRNETSEAYVRKVLSDPAAALADFGITITDRKLDQFPKEHAYFTQDLYEVLFGQMRWHLELSRREHDTTVIAQIMRMRGDTQSPDIFQSRHILITKNAPLAQLGRRFCIEQGLLPKNAVGPAIHQRQLATAVWLRTGLSDAQDIPKRYLLAACERVLELKKNVVDQVRLVARSLNPEKAEQLDLLLTQDRSVQVLMDKTLGVSQVISSSNIEAVIDNMKAGLVADIERDKKAEVRKISEDSRKKIRAADEGRTAAEERAAGLEVSLTQAAAEDRATIQILLDEVNGHLKVVRRLASLGIAAVVLAIGILPLLAEWVSGRWKYFFLAAATLIAAIQAIYQLLDRPTGIKQSVDAYGLRRLQELAVKRGLKTKLDRHPVELRDGRLCLKSELSQRSDLLIG